MTNLEKRASAQLSTAGTWLERGEAAARAVGRAVRVVDGWLTRAFAGLAAAQARRQARRELYALDDRILADIGLRREQVADCVDAMFRGNSATSQANASAVLPSEDVTEINAEPYESAA